MPDKQLHLYEVCPKQCVAIKEAKEREYSHANRKLRIQLQAARRLIKELLDSPSMGAYEKAEQDAALFLDYAIPEPERSMIDSLWKQ